MPLVVDSTPARPRHSLRIQLLLFLFLWFGYGLVINSANLTAFGLQQAGVEAYVERHHLYLEGSQVELLKVRPVVDAFLYNDHIYPAKQPGQFMAGALAYVPLHCFGLSYSNHYLLTAAMVTFLTASLLTALGALAVFRCVLLLQDSTELFWPMTVTLLYAFGTTAFAYSGIAWHDSIATSYLVLSFYVFLESERAGNERRQLTLMVLGGLLLGLTITTSMLPFLMVVVLSGYYVASSVYGASSIRAAASSVDGGKSRSWRRLALFVTGIALGLLPLLIYNAICFGNPFLLPNVAGDYRDTFLHLSAENFLQKLGFYTHMLTIYTPVFWLGIIGLALFPRSLRREQSLLALLLFASFAYILNIDATGTCQYGPRYLLPAMPFASLGLVGFRSLAPKWRRAMVPVVIIVGIVSVAINSVGALHGAMLCDFPHFAAGLYLSQMLNGQLRSYPLVLWLIAPFIMSVVFLAWKVKLERARYIQ